MKRINHPQINRRKLLIGGGVGVGLLVSWGLLPRHYPANLRALEGEHLFGPWLKIAEDGKIIIAIPQCDSGQGIYTTLAQIVAGELGADWRTVAIQPVMPSPHFANLLIAQEWATAFAPDYIDPQNGGPLAREMLETLATRQSFVITGGSSSIRQFELPCRQAGAAARVLLCQAAAKRWGTNWESCDTDKGFVTFGQKRLSFADLVVDAVGFTVPDPIPLQTSPINHLSGKDAPRLDLPAKVDGSANYAGDIRLPDMLYASIRGGPIGQSRVKSLNSNAARLISGVIKTVRTDYWVAALATNWWAANRALDAMAPVFETKGRLASSSDIARALERAITKGPGKRQTNIGSVDATLAKGAGTRVYRAEYNISPAVHAPLETYSATAHLKDGRLQLWMASQAPQSAIEAAANAIGISSKNVILYPVQAGGSFDRNFDCQIAAQVAVLAREAGRPVQLIWSRAEDFMRDHYRAPVLGRITGSLDTKGQIAGLAIRIATPPFMRELAKRLDGKSAEDARAAVSGDYDPMVLEGAVPPYAIANLSVDHFPANIPVPTGPWRGMAHGYTAFMVESFIDEMAQKAGVEPLSYRMQMLIGQTRLARCLTGVAAMAGWDGGASGSSNGIACHSMRDSHIAVIASARTSENGIRVSSINAMVDCGRLINPDVARQVIEGGILFGLSQALGSATEFENGLPVARRMRDMDLPVLADIPEISVEFVHSEEAPGGVSEIGVPAVAPAVANALFSASGVRMRDMPLLSRGL